MDELIARATAFISHNGAWAGPIIGLLAFGESLAVVGILIPATALMVAVGGMIGSGLIEPVPVLACAIIGAILGDWVSFALGRRIGPAGLRSKWLRKHRLAVARARLFFRRYGLVAILVGRFLGPVRATVPLVAGVMQMKSRPFQIANVVSAIFWVPALFAPGFLAVRSFGTIGPVTPGQLLAFGGVMALTMVGGAWLGARILGGGGKRRVRGPRA